MPRRRRNSITDFVEGDPNYRVEEGWGEEDYETSDSDEESASGESRSSSGSSTSNGESDRSDGDDSSGRPEGDQENLENADMESDDLEAEELEELIDLRSVSDNDENNEENEDSENGPPPRKRRRLRERRQVNYYPGWKPSYVQNDFATMCLLHLTPTELEQIHFDHGSEEKASPPPKADLVANVVKDAQFLLGIRHIVQLESLEFLDCVYSGFMTLHIDLEDDEISDHGQEVPLEEDLKTAIGSAISAITIILRQFHTEFPDRSWAVELKDLCMKSYQGEHSDRILIILKEMDYLDRVLVLSGDGTI